MGGGEEGIKAIKANKGRLVRNESRVHIGLGRIL